MRPTRVTVDLDAIAHNTRLLVAAAAPSRLCSVVKADAYGHGMVPVAQATLAAGAWGLAVALVEEASALRDAGVRAPVYVLAGNFSGSHAQVVAQGLTPVVGRLEDLIALNDAVALAGAAPLAVHLELDTGMARLGFHHLELRQAAAFAAGLPHLEVVGLMTHLSHSDDLGAPSTPRQIARLDAARLQAAGHLPKLAVCHVLNSGGLVSAPPHPWDMVRCGLSLYGVQPVAGHDFAPLRPVLRWSTRPIAIRQLAAGEPVSYGSHWHAPRPSVIATLPVGYADGYPRACTGRAQVLVAGARAPVVGTICMDLCMIDVTDLPQVTTADEVVLLGEQQGASLQAHELAGWANTISYEILARIGPRVPRFYLGPGAC